MLGAVDVAPPRSVEGPAFIGAKPAVSLFRLRGFDRLASGLPPVGWKDPLHLLASQTPTCTGSLVRRGVWAPTWGPSLARRDLSRPSFADPQTAQKADSRLSGA